MVVNTINDLVTLLNLADQDVTVLGSIANDSATETGSGIGPGLVTTREGGSVKNVQKVIADIENDIVSGLTPYADRATAIAATVPPQVNRILVYTPDGDTVAFVEDASGTAMTTAGARKWSPDGVGSYYHFGALGDAIISATGTLTSGTDDTVALQAALDWMAAVDGRKLSAEGSAVYRINGELSGSGALNINMGSARLFQTSNNVIMDWTATLFGPYDIAANYTAGDLAIDLTGAPLPVAPRAGYIMKIVSDAVDPKNRDSGSETEQYRTGEFFVVGSGSTTTNIVLDRALVITRGISPTSTAGDEADVDPYTTTMNARVVYGDNDEKFELIGGTYGYEEGQEATWAKGAVRVTGFVSPLIERPFFDRTYGFGLRVNGNYGAIVNQVGGKNLENDTASGQYGYLVADGSENTKVTGLHGHDARHIYTSSVNNEQADESSAQPIMSIGRVRGAQVIGGHATGGDNAHWDTHHSTESATFRDNYSTGAGETSSAFRGRDVTCVNHTSRGAGEGVKYFTEYNSGDADDDFYTAGKTLGDMTSGRAGDLDIECVEVPFEGSHADVELFGNSKFVSQDHCAIFNLGGVVTVSGYQEFTSIAGGVVHARTGCIEIEATNALLTGAFPKAQVIIEGTVVIDATDAAAGTVNAMALGTNCELIVRGRLVFKLPAGAGWISGTGSVWCEGDGVIEFEVASAADNTIITDAGDLTNMRVRSTDGTVRWDDAKTFASPAGFQTFHTSAVGVSHAGTGAEVQDLYDPEGQYAFKALNDRGEGMIRVKLSGTKIGATAAATLYLRVGASTFVTTHTIAIADDLWQFDGVMNLTATDAQLYNIRFNTDAATALKRSAETAGAGADTTPAFSFGIDAAVGDTITIETCEVYATAGGIL
tara:strand:- start:2812 stop:5463 length:2652 start_codon:yes stop_codon:yes gene_type:complete